MGTRISKFATSFILTIVLSALVILLHAQTEKGMLVVGGSADISESIQGTTKNFNLALQPVFGVFVINNFAIGGIYSFGAGSLSSYDPSTDIRTTTTTFTTLVGPFLKYYIGKKPMKPFISANIGYSVLTAIASQTGSSSGLANVDGFQTTGSVGIAYFFNPHVSLETALYITNSAYQTLLPTTRFGLSLGLYVFLDKKKKD